MAMVPYQPASILDQLYREMDRAFGSADRGEESAVSDWLPAVDIKEEDDAFIIHADVPGVDPKDIDIQMENGVLTLRGERKWDKEEEKKGYKRVERVRGTFFRRFTLPDTADADKIAAKVDKGVLEIRIPKQEKVRPRKITVQG